MPSDSTDPGPTDPPPADSSLEDTSGEALPIEATECPNCSWRFVGTYCPNCGQENSPASVLDLVSGFLREVVDLDGGFWPTLTALTTQPGHTLRRYLRGARRSYMHPGRYLLAAIVVATLLTQFMGQVGLTTGAGPADIMSEDATAPDSASVQADSASVDTSSFAYKLGYVLGQTAEATGIKEDSGAQSVGDASGEEGAAERSERSNPLSALGNHYARMLFAATMAMFLGLVYRRMFPDEFPRVAPAIAVSMFVIAHLTLLEHALNAPITVFQYIRTGGPVESGSNVLSLVLLLLGSGVAMGACFGPKEGVWRAGLKGGIAAVIAQIDAVAFLIFALAVYWGGWSFWVPGEIPPGHPLFWFLAIAVVLGVAILSLPHLGLVLYRRLHSNGTRET